MFVNRVRELKFLQDKYTSNSAELVVLYGRRRVGKTELVRTFCQGKPHIFFVADLGTEANMLAEFTRQLSEFIYRDETVLPLLSSWDAALTLLAAHIKDERVVVVLDEFTYLISVNPAVPSIFQKLWDTRLKETQIMLILCGSYVGMIEQEVLAYRSPLYGRRTGQWRLQPFSFWDAHQLLPDLNGEEMVHAYAILGGIPAYLRRFNDQAALLDNIERHIFTTGEFLYDEPRFLLLQELRDPNRYFAVLEAIAGGRTRMNEIAQAAHTNPSSISFYLKTLQEMGLIARLVPATESNPDKSKQGIYRLTDQFFRFWFRFVYPNRSLLERGETGQVRRVVADQLEQFTGQAFELICLEYLWRRQSVGKLSFTPRVIGNWWDRQEEIDIMAIGADAVLFGECKWSSKPLGGNILADLKRKAQIVLQRQPWNNVTYALFARAGFTPALQAQAELEGVLLVNLNELIVGEEGTK